MASTEMWVGHSSPTYPPNGRTFTLYSWTVTTCVVAFIAYGVYGSRTEIESSAVELVIWTMCLAVLNLFDLRASSGRALSPDTSLYVALALTFPPAIGGLVAFVGTIDRREFEGRTTLTTALFNRSQSALSVIVPSIAVGLMPNGGSLQEELILGTLIALPLMTLMNYSLVATAAWLAEESSFTSSIRNLTFGHPADFALIWVSWGLMGMLLVAAREAIGVLAVAIFTLPALVGRQVLARSKSTQLAQTAVHAKQDAIAQLSARIADERKDERQRIASQLHDEVLQPLFQVSLLCDVVRADSSTGRLLDLDKDVPLLRQAAEMASRNLRGVIGRLRNSPLGLRGLSSTLRGLLRDLAPESRAVLVNEIEDVGTLSPSLQLIVYQVAKEAIINSVRHGRAHRVITHLTRDTDAVRLSVEDDGIGFDSRASQQDHFGLLIMRERTESVGGILHIDSQLGTGTIVAARFPIDCDP